MCIDISLTLQISCAGSQGTPSLITDGSNNIIAFAVLQQHENTIHAIVNLFTSHAFQYYLGEVEDTPPTCTNGRPGSFISSELPCRRAALCGFKSRSCCMSIGSTQKTACRSPFSFWQVDADSALALPDCYRCI